MDLTAPLGFVAYLPAGVPVLLNLLENGFNRGLESLGRNIRVLHVEPLPDLLCRNGEEITSNSISWISADSSNGYCYFVEDAL